MTTKAFTLLEIAVATAVLGILAMIAVPSLAERLETARIEAEKQMLDGISSDLKRSFLEMEWSRNVCAFAGHLPPRVEPTDFSPMATVNATAVDSSWYVKIGRLRGISPQIGEPINEESQQSLHSLATNSFGSSRVLVAGPEEPGQQRYLLFSVVAPETAGLVVPENDGSTSWFDAMWNHSFEGTAGTLPEDWSHRLTTEQAMAWASGRGTSTRVRCLVVQRIVQPKYRIIVNNTHPGFSAWLDYEGSRSKLTSAPASGVSTSEEIPAGRLIVVRRGVADPGAEAYRFYLNEPTSVSVQQ